MNPQAGGAETHLHEVFGRLATRGHDISLLTSGFPGGGARERLDGLDVHRIGTRFTFGLHVPLYLKHSLDPDDFDIVVEDLNKVPVFMPFWTDTPVVLLVHHLFGTTAFQEASIPMASATWLLEQPIPRVFEGSHVVAVSRSTADDLYDRGLRGPEVSVIPNGVDLSLFTPSPEEAEFEEPTVVYLGRLKRYKRVDLLIRAVARLRDEDFSVRLLVIGKGEYERDLRLLTSKLSLNEHIQFLGYVGEEDKIRYLRRAWIHALTSPKEGWGISIIEAAACGTPTVASDSPGLRDAVLDGQTGVLVPHGDVELLAGALRKLAEDQEARRGMGGAARAYAENFSWENSAVRMEALLEDRVAGDHPQA